MYNCSESNGGQLSCHVDQFKEISQASEAALVVLNMTFDEYKALSEASIVRHEVSLAFSKIFCKKIMSFLLVRDQVLAGEWKQRACRDTCQVQRATEGI